MKNPIHRRPGPATFSINSPRDGAGIAGGKRALACNLLTARELGERFGRSQFTVYRWIEEGLIPERFLRYTGRRQMLIGIDAVGHLHAAFRGMHD